MSTLLRTLFRRRAGEGPGGGGEVEAGHEAAAAAEPAGPEETSAAAAAGEERAAPPDEPDPANASSLHLAVTEGGAAPLRGQGGWALVLCLLGVDSTS